MRMKTNQKGFTLVELMIVVAIIGILAAIAIPNFRNYQMKSKTGEAKVNLGAIKTSMETYRAENNVYLAAAANPTNVPGANKGAWNTDGLTPTVAVAAPATVTAWTSIGFAPSGNVFYSYGIASIGAAAGTATDYLAGAWGDLDGTPTYTGAAAVPGPVAILAADTATAVGIFTTAGQIANGSTFTMTSTNVLTDRAPGVW